MRCGLFFVTIGLFSLCSQANAADWPMFRGPQGNGVSTDTGFPTEWAADKNVKWKVDLPNPANGSPIVSNGRVFVTNATEDGRKRGLICFDRTDGKQLWEKYVEFAEDETHSQNPYGSATPVADGQRVVVWHSSAGLYCYDFSGKELWSRDLGEFKHIWGYGSSPIIYQDRVILHCGPGKRSFLTAINIETGKTLWETDEPYEGKKEYNDVGSWSTPVIANVDGADQIIHTTSTALNGYDPQTGKRLWWCDGLSGSRYDAVSTSPLIAGDLCVVMGDLRGPAMGVKLGGAGDVTASQRLWLYDKRNPSFVGTGILLDGHVYRPTSSPGTLECIEAKTGERAWVARAASGNYWASIVLADGLLYSTSQKGVTVVFKPNTKELEEVSRNDLEQTCNATPAFSDGEIFIRTHDALYCIAGK